MLSAVIKQGAVSYNIALATIEKGGRWQRALVVLPEMFQNTVEPCMVTWSSAISATEKKKSWEASLGILWALPRRSLEPDGVSFGSAIAACGKTKEKAFDLLRAMRQRTLEADLVSHTSAINAFEGVTHWREALGLLGQTSQLLLQLQGATYNVAMRACEKDSQ